MRKDEGGGWNPVETLDRSIGRQEMAEKVQDDEIYSFVPVSETHKTERGEVETYGFTGAEIVKAHGVSFLREQTYSSQASDESEQVKSVILNDEEWLVNS